MKINKILIICFMGIVLPYSNCTALFPTLYSASPLIFVTVVLCPLTGFMKIINSIKFITKNSRISLIFY
jgi:hypothetical protein